MSEKSCSIFSWQKRKHYAFIAIGKTLPDEEYHGLYGYIRGESVQEEEKVDQVQTIAFPSNHGQQKVITTDTRQSIETITAEDCQIDLDNMYSEMKNMIRTNASKNNIIVGVSKLCELVKKYPISKLTSSLHNFGVPLQLLERSHN